MSTPSHVLEAVDAIAHRGGDADDWELLERVATIVAPYCLVGWDTGGEPWQP